MAFQRIGILGGTFDPIHYGHLRIAEIAREAYALEQIVFVPNSRSPFKAEAAVSLPEERCAMAELAIAGNSAFCVSRMEAERAGLSYAVDTVRALRLEHPTLETLYFIIGADTVPDLHRWHEAEELGRLCKFAAVTRPGIEPAQMPPGVEVLRAPGLEISSTDLRRRVRDGRSIKYLVPEPVEAYIHSRKLYYS